jgi:hypothetical protein
MSELVMIGRGAFKERIQELCLCGQTIGITNAGECEHVMVPMEAWLQLTAKCDVNAPVVELPATVFCKKLKDNLEAKQVIIVLGANGRQTNTVVEKSIYDTLVEYSQ